MTITRQSTHYRTSSNPPPYPIQDRCHDPLEIMESLAAATSWRRGRQIYGRGDPAEHWYRVVSGAARKCALKADGRCQILEIMLPGDFFGFTAHNQHMFCVEAVVDGTIAACYPRRRLERMADTDPELAHFIRDSAFDAMSRMQTRMLTLGQMSAREKVSSFVLEMADRSPGRTAGAVDLPMSRYDIADYLALSVETVSRALTRLRHHGAIAIAGKHRVRIIDRNALSEGADVAE